MQYTLDHDLTCPTSYKMCSPVRGWEKLKAILHCLFSKVFYLFIFYVENALKEMCIRFQSDAQIAFGKTISAESCQNALACDYMFNFYHFK